MAGCSIGVPFSMMVFETARRNTERLKPSYGKWLSLFLLTFLFNGLGFFSRWWLTLFDLGLKCSLYFLPEEVVPIPLFRTTSSNNV
jgi:hypothetical protein